MNDGTVKALGAMAALAAVEIAALSMGYDGAILAGVVAALAALGGYTYGRGR